jgi:hypothetical protein
MKIAHKARLVFIATVAAAAMTVATAGTALADPGSQSTGAGAGKVL